MCAARSWQAAGVAAQAVGKGKQVAAIYSCNESGVLCFFLLEWTPRRDTLTGDARDGGSQRWEGPDRWQCNWAVCFFYGSGHRGEIHSLGMQGMVGASGGRAAGGAPTSSPPSSLSSQAVQGWSLASPQAARVGRRERCTWAAGRIRAEESLRRAGKRISSPATKCCEPSGWVNVAGIVKRVPKWWLISLYYSRDSQ